MILITSLQDKKLFCFLNWTERTLNKVQYMFELLWIGKEQEIKSAITNKSYDDLRDLCIMMSNRAIFTLHIRNIVKKDMQRQDGICIESVSVAEALSHAENWNVLSFPDESTAPSCGIHGKQETYKLSKIFNERLHKNHWSIALKLLGKTVQTQIVLSPETPWTLYNYIYSENNTTYGAKYLWHNGAQNKNQKIPKTWNTVRSIQQTETQHNPFKKMQ